jgi:uncharacterized protein YjbI with pentapeptide repeats
VAALVLLGGCGDGNDHAQPSDDGSSALHSAVINQDEQAFALDPTLLANPDDIVTLRLEDPAGDYVDELDSGDEPGVDVIPYYFSETLERRICWENDPGADPVPVGVPPAFMELRHAAGELALRVEQDGDCVTQTVPAGHYRAVFHHGASARTDRDLVFILPQNQDDAASLRRPGVIGEPSFDRTPDDLELIPPAPFCGYGAPKDEDGIGVVARVANCQPKVPFELFTLKSSCTDLSLIVGHCPLFPHAVQGFYVITLPDHHARVYEDLFFRGPRKTVSLPAPPVPFIQDAFGFTAPGSLLVAEGSPTHNRDIVIRTNGCDQCNLGGVDLHGVDLRGAWLRLSDLSHADLSGAHLEKALLEQTLFKSAHLVGTHFEEAYLAGALFDSAGPIEEMPSQSYPAADLTEAKFGKADLSDAWLVGAKLTKADLSGVVAARTNFSGVSAVEAVFDGAMLTPDVSLRKSTLTKASFLGASMSHVVLTEAVADGAKFNGATMSFANVRGAILTGARMENVKLDQAIGAPDPSRGIGPCSLEHAYLYNADLSSADMTSVKFQGARWYGELAKANNAVLTNAVLFNAELASVNFTSAILHNAKFDGAHCVACTFNSANMAATSSSTSDGASFLGTDLRGASLRNAMIAGCDFTNAWVSFGPGIYTTGGGDDFLYLTDYQATNVDPLKLPVERVVCPDGRPGPCTTRDRLLPRDGTPTPTPTHPRPTPTATARSVPNVARP